MGNRRTTWTFDRSWRHSFAIIAAIANYFILIWAWDKTVVKDAKGRFHSLAEVGAEFYVLSAVLLVSCLGTAFIIRYESSDLSWGARILFCFLPALAGLYLLATKLGFLN